MQTKKEKFNNYETVVIIGAQELSQEDSDKIINDFVKLLKDNKSSVTHLDSWGRKKLAYKIQKQEEGYYYVIEHVSLGENIALYETTLKRNESVLRFLTVGLDKHALKYNERKRAKAAEEVEQG